MEKIEENLGFLPEGQRAVYTAIKNDSTHEELSAKLGIPPDVVKGYYLAADRNVQEYKAKKKFQNTAEPWIRALILFGEVLATIHTLQECRTLLEQELLKKKVYYEALLTQQLKTCNILLKEFEDVKEEFLRKVMELKLLSCEETKK